MKKLLTAFFFTLPVLASANHNMAGDISYTHVSGYTYTITVRTFTNTSGTTADRCELYLNGDTSAVLPRINGPSALCPSTHDGNMIPSCVGNTKMNIYTGTVTFPGPGTYSVSIEDPNRSAGICNIPSSVNISFHLGAEIVINAFTGGNSGPVYNSVPLNCDTVNIISNYNPLVTDLDGDSLFYELIPAMANGAAIMGYSNPPSSSSFSIDSSTGLLTWNTPTMVCTYAYCIKISEWRNVGGTYYYLGSTMQEIWDVIQPYTGIEEGSAASFSVFPNPAQDYLNVEMHELSFSYDHQLFIFGSSGKLIKTLPLKGNSSVPLSDLSEGLYYYRITNGKGIEGKGKFIILRESVK